MIKECSFLDELSLEMSQNSIAQIAIQNTPPDIWITKNTWDIKIYISFKNLMALDAGLLWNVSKVVSYGI